MAGDSDSDKVAKLVKLKLEDYFNRQRVENEFDPSGKGIHTTTPQVVQLELSYLQAAEQQWKAKKKDARQKNQDTKENKKETQKPRDGDKSNETELSPRIKKNSKLKSRVKGSEIERITKNAQTSMSQVSFNRIHSVHRYRPHLTPGEYVDLGKVAHVSPHVNAILNTEYAWKSAEDNDDREAARKYVQEKMESQAKEKADKKEERPASTDSRDRTPLWLRVQKESQSNKENITGEPDQEEYRATEDSEDVSKNDKTRKQDDEDGLDGKLPREDQDGNTTTDDRQDTSNDQDKDNGDIGSGGNNDAVNDNPRDDMQDVERETEAKEVEQIQDSDIKEHEIDNDGDKGIPDDKDEHKSEEIDNDGRKSEEIDNDGRKSEEINNDGHKSEEIDNDGHKSEEIDNDGHKSEEIDNDGHKSEEIDNDGHKSEEIDNDGHKSEEIDNDGHKSEEIDNDGHKSEEIDNDGHKSEEIDNDGHKSEEIDNDGHKSEEIDNDGHKSEEIDNDGHKSEEIDNDGHKGILDDKDEHKSEEYVRTESMLSLTTDDNNVN